MGTARQNRSSRRQKAQHENKTQASMDVYEFHPKTISQRNLWTLLHDESSPVTIAVGPAGVGKTLVGLHAGLLGMAARRYDKVVYVRSDVGMDYQQSLGALPGEYLEKSTHLIAPVLDNLRFMMRSRSAGEYLLNKEKLEIVRLDGIRGRSFTDTFVLVDEAQNMSPDNIKTCISRIGPGSRIMLCGDPSQVDHYAFRKGPNGLEDAVRRLNDVKEVGLAQFTREDIVRNKFLQAVLSKYEEA